MTLRASLPASLALNLVLLLALALTFRPKPLELPLGVTQKVELQSGGRDQPATEGVESAAIPVASAPWNWSQLVQDPLPAYRDGLRAIGCPDPTIREILSPILFRQFQERCRRELAPWTTSFWERLSGGSQKTMDEFRAFSERLKQEHQRAQGDLLGRLSEASVVEPVGEDPAAQFMPADVQSAVQEASRRHQERIRDWANSPDGRGTNRAVVFAALEAQYAEELSNLIPADQAAEYQRRNSGHASLRLQEAMDLRESEMQAIVDLYDRTSQDANGSARTAGLKRLLGDDRAAEFERTQDPNYRQLSELGRRAGIPPEKTLDLWEAERSAENAVRELASNTNLPVDERESRMIGVRDSVSATAEGLLGARGISAWRHLRSDWLNGTFHVPPFDPLQDLPPAP